MRDWALIWRFPSSERRHLSFELPLQVTLRSSRARPPKKGDGFQVDQYVRLELPGAWAAARDDE